MTIRFVFFNVRVFRERLSICVYSSFPFGFEGGVWDLIVIFPDHCIVLLQKFLK